MLQVAEQARSILDDATGKHANVPGSGGTDDQATGLGQCRHPRDAGEPGTRRHVGRIAGGYIAAGRYSLPTRKRITTTMTITPTIPMPPLL
jgi:hypothetical protein